MSSTPLYYSTSITTSFTLSTTIPDSQGLKRCIQYIETHTHKSIFPFPPLYKTEIIIMELSGRQYEYDPTQNCPYFNQYSDHDHD